MAPLTFADTHNMVAYLSKSDASEGFDQILDFLNASTIRYALTVNPTIYVSCIKKFWSTAKLKTVNGVVQLQALIDGKKVFVSKAIIRRDLHLEDAKRVECLPNNEIFEELARMGAKRTAWNEFSSTMASAVICLATCRKFNISKYIFESMVRNVDSSAKFLIYPRFIQVFLDNQVDDMTSHHTKYTSPALTQKVFTNIRRVATTSAPSTSELQDHPSTPHDSPEQEPTHSSPHDSPLTGVNPPGSEEGSLQLAKLMALYTTLQRKVDALERYKLAQATKILSFKKRVEKLEKRRKLKPSILKISSATRVESSEEASLGAEENDPVHKQVTVGVLVRVERPPHMGPHSGSRQHSRVEYPMLMARLNQKIRMYR
ncbi:hypothetical protein Tco_1166460 [Tanacetum coccineum]